MTRPRLKISCSFGRTSVFMTWCLWWEYKDAYDIVVTFCNTGEEQEETLLFGHRFEQWSGIPIIWLEAVVDPREGYGTTHKIVSYETASRKGEPFEQVMQKYGLPNRTFQNCNRELKLRPMESYMRSIGWEKGSYVTAVGIRADEADRMSSKATQENIIYPLVKWGVTKEVVLFFFKFMPFDLYIPEHKGNCKVCHKKSLRKLMTIAVESPEDFAFFRYAEQKYKDHGAGDGNRKLYRGNRTVEDIFEMAKRPFEKFVDSNQVFDPELDVGNGCGGSESCEIYADE